MSRGHDADAGIGRLVGKAVHERPLRVFWRSGRYGVGHRFDADAKLDLVSCRRSMDVSLMGGLVVWLAGPFTNGPYRVFGCCGVGDRFDADAELDMVASCRSMDVWR